MMRMTVKVKGFTKDKGFRSSKKRIVKRLSGITGEAAQRVRKTTVQMMSEPKSGIHHRGLPRRSSAVGEAPAIQSGALAASLRINSEGRDHLHHRIGTPLWYGNYLMMRKGRPALLPALKKVFPSYVEEIRDMIGREV